MFDSDFRIKAKIEQLGGSYRRYSDDVLLIVPVGKAAEAEKIVADELSRIYLTVNKRKTVRSRAFEFETPQSPSL